ncbi:MAG: acylaldehyde oxidase [Amycolatopsis sp.]|uniref:xanthine dehydrogenase family protein molybdopterin-binding subunit n=1 Tax=Amycolatopsis sp. TaxID=37632 RepID=UPI0026076C90|nr:xanthine dehydrogenase family protein molybdopterin-binding subunit [Amycolatopsis sp.]MCU1687392.1 acylaldehyde oxidase [Amycolatopsis sp.]
MTTNTSVGKSVSRVDGRLKVTGQATYAAEHDVPGVVYGVIVGSTISKGTITAIDTAKASRVPGVIKVLTHLNTAKLPYPEHHTVCDPPGERLHVMADATVKFFGEPVALVVASSQEAAEHAVSLVKVTYATLPAITDIDDPKASSMVSPWYADYERGDPDTALRGAHITLDRTYRIAREHHNPMELASVIARWDGGKLTLWDKTQWVQGSAEFVAFCFGIDPADVRVISPFVGGAFGSGSRAWPHEVLAAQAARELGRPVKVVLTRKQMYTSIGCRPASSQHIVLGSTTDGVITALIHEARTETSQYEQHSDAIPELPRMLYAIPNMRSQYRLVELDTNTPTWMRGPGEAPSAFALECAVDELAHELKIDPVELRIRNEPATDPFQQTPFSVRRLTDCYRVGAEKFGWSRRSATPGSRKEGNLLVGMGMAAAGYYSYRVPADASARINADGTAVVASATSDIGPGTYTSMTQLSADALGLPMNRVTFQLGDSLLPMSPVEAGSKTMASVGSAVQLTCNMLRDSFVRMASVDPGSPLYGARPDQVSVDNGRLHWTDKPQRGETYQQILARHGRQNLEVHNGYVPGEEVQKYSTWAYGAVFAEVSVDVDLGLVRIRRIFGAYEAGKIVSPKMAHSQAIGGMVGGIGMSLLESTAIDHRDGRIPGASLADYLVPVNADVPELDAVLLNAPDGKADPIGVKGLGEVVIVGVPAAIANAVFNATGKRQLELPITLDKLL